MINRCIAISLEILGGGLAVGSVLLLEEDLHSEHFRWLLKYYLAEGIAVDHSLTVFSTEEPQRQITRRLPKNMTIEELELQRKIDSDRLDMKVSISTDEHSVEDDADADEDISNMNAIDKHFSASVWFL